MASSAFLQPRPSSDPPVSYSLKEPYFGPVDSAITASLYPSMNKDQMHRGTQSTATKGSIAAGDGMEANHKGHNRCRRWYKGNCKSSIAAPPSPFIHLFHYISQNIRSMAFGFNTRQSIEIPLK